MNKKTSFYILFIIILSVTLISSFSSISFAAYPKLVSKLLNGFETIKGWIIKIATPAAAVAVRQWNIYEKI